MKLIVSLLLVASTIILSPLSFAQNAPSSQPVSRTESPAQPGATSTATSGPDRRLAAMVPSGMTTEAVCTGFKSLSDCSAALHVSRNLNIPFADVRDRMASGQSLAVAVHALQPSADSPKEARRAEDQAREDLKPGS